jgi:hypothetical protein
MILRQTINRKTSILILAILLALTSSLTVTAQNKFHYLFIDFNISYNDSINYTINVSGLDSILKDKIKLFTSKKIKIKTENELFNAIGRLGWELYMIEDIPNKITQVRREYNGQPTGDYNLSR